MPSLHIGIQTASLRLPLKKALHIAARLGAEAVEIDARNELSPDQLSQTAMRQFRNLLTELGLRVAAVRFPTRRGYNVREDLDRRVAATKEVMRFAHALGASVVTNHVGSVPEDDKQPEWQLMVDALTDLGRHGDRVGARLAATTGSESGSHLARLLVALPEQSVGVDFSPAGLIAGGYSVVDSLQALRQSVLHFRANNAVRDPSRGRGIEVPLGRGMADYPSLLGLLEESHYRGYFTIEQHEAGDPANEIGEAVKFLRTIAES